MKITGFALGRTIATKTVMDHPEVSMFVPSILRHHRNCDYGDICKEDIEMNNSALRMMTGRVVSSYQVQAKKVFVITEGLGTQEHLATTVMFAEEY